MKEHLFHKIWVRFAPEFRHLITTAGEVVEISSYGSHNYGDGPDFHLGAIRLNGLKQFGDIELHIRCEDWYAHRHHLDPAYNAVVLHVVLDDKNAGPVAREDGTMVPTVVIRNRIPTKLLSTIRESVGQYELRCKHVIQNISPTIIEQQLKAASEIYLEEKKQQLLDDYDTSLRPSEAWLKLVFIGWARGLGIPTNSVQLAELAEFMWNSQDSNDKSALREKVASIPWDHSGSRPGNRPEIRYRQLQHLLIALNIDTFSTLVKGKPGSIFDFFDTQHFGGQERRILLLSIVVAPAVIILGELLGNVQFIDSAIRHWNEVGFRAPYSIINPFKKAGITHLKNSQSPGLVYQYKHFCTKRACDACLIFKNAVGG